MSGPADDPYLRELGRRALEEMFDEDYAHRLLNGQDPDPSEGDVFEEPESEPDPVLADFYGGLSLRALGEARDGLAAANVRYEEAVVQARAAGWTWPEIGRVLGVSKQALHSRFRDRTPG